MTTPKKKAQLSVYLDPDVMQALSACAARREKSMSLIAEAAIASFLSPDGDERKEAAIAKRLDQQDRRLARLERDVGIGVETLALFIRFWLNTTPPLPEPAAKAARAQDPRLSLRFFGPCAECPHVSPPTTAGEVGTVLSDTVRRQAREAVLAREIGDLRLARGQAEQAYEAEAIGRIYVRDVDRDLLSASDDLAQTRPDAARAAVAAYRAHGGDCRS
jgi:predicted transcriptional regulator